MSLGGLIAKVLGALYRIPLTNVIGSYGMGLYQLVFPAYILFLTMSQAGVPVALSKLIAENKQLGREDHARKIFRFCFWTLLATGALGAGLLAALSQVISRAQGNPDTASAFLLIAPALLFIPVTNVLKGYFQGNMNMLPSSVTTVVEQVVKLAVGLFLAVRLMPDVLAAVRGATFAITVSEFTSLLIMTSVYAVHRRKDKFRLSFEKGEVKNIASEVFALCVPVALGAFVMQISQVVDSVMVVNLLSADNATSLYGLWTGPVNSMLGLPIAVSSGVAVSALPSITKTFADGDSEKLNKAYNSAMKLTLIITLPTSLGLIVMSRPIISLLYGGLTAEEIQISATLLSFSGISVVFLSVAQTSVSVLQAVGKPYVSVVVLALAVVVKAVVNVVLLPLPQINIYGAAISETMCYLFATIGVIIYSSTKLKLKVSVGDCLLKPLSCSLVMTLVLTVLTAFAKDFVSSAVGTIVSIVGAGAVYFAAVLIMKVFDSSELRLLPVKLG